MQVLELDRLIEMLESNSKDSVILAVGIYETLENYKKSYIKSKLHTYPTIIDSGIDSGWIPSIDGNKMFNSKFYADDRNKLIYI